MILDVRWMLLSCDQPGPSLKWKRRTIIIVKHGAKTLFCILIEQIIRKLQNICLQPVDEW